MPQRRGLVIELHCDLAADLPAVRGAENEIRDALTNLIFNAVDAMPSGGTIDVRTSLHDSGNGQRTVRLEVRDSGVGMDEETRARCLEPFFTTKGERGTGMGLAMVYGMAQRHGRDARDRQHAGRSARPCDWCCARRRRRRSKRKRRPVAETTGAKAATADRRRRPGGDGADANCAGPRWPSGHGGGRRPGGDRCGSTGAA